MGCKVWVLRSSPNHSTACACNKCKGTICDEQFDVTNISACFAKVLRNKWTSLSLPPDLRILLEMKIDITRRSFHSPIGWLDTRLDEWRYQLYLLSSNGPNTPTVRSAAPLPQLWSFPTVMRLRGFLISYSLQKIGSCSRARRLTTPLRAIHMQRRTGVVKLPSRMGVNPVNLCWDSVAAAVDISRN